MYMYPIYISISIWAIKTPLIEDLQLPPLITPEDSVLLKSLPDPWPFRGWPRSLKSCEIPRISSRKAGVYTSFIPVLMGNFYKNHQPDQPVKSFDTLWEFNSLRTGKSPSLSSVNQLFLWAMFHSYVTNYQRVILLYHSCWSIPRIRSGKHLLAKGSQDLGSRDCTVRADMTLQNVRLP